MTDSTGRWLQAAGTAAPLLTASQELTLGRSVREWLDWPGGPEGAPAAVKQRGLRARDRMVQSNLRLVMAVAKRYWRTVHQRGLAMEDALQEGALGLTHAIEKFEPAKGYRLSTYAFWWIRQSIHRWLGSAGLVRVPSNVSELSARLLQGEASSLSASERERALAALAVSHLARLDAPVGDDNSPLGELLAAPQDDPLHQLDLDLRLRPLKAALPDDMALLLELQVEKPAVVARHRGVSRQAISQQATKAMMRVRMLG
ncbi:sigma-70 family RNA polymerase sigma factor [Synechococcus sp. HJ21-Hayes]|jgi:RNA polymerase sigma factor (sigma-70 family)|uniref:sigma-70 family RNA polymerase sigma factor n=1 Tax=unclassified Synechococcus TaxID=2626047 RepID=UPI0020CE1AC2|nr:MULTISPECIES: sigma-70 family RNA polymerase sigma factor [unclassified Synechococcus]MCP9830828.1 sigma-70 family RNA polymerase sigma factor [Synechococcus sp. JJ3a-Johnson]MCP9853125.1 sigma-70 family RNA polymerase sigma factor [Synechococcus sp. HJ21-Hayes]